MSDQFESILDQPLAYFRELEDIQRRQAHSSSTSTAGLLEAALHVAESRVDELCSNTDVLGILETYLSDIETDSDNLEFLHSLQSSDELSAQIVEQEHALESRKSDPRYRLAMRYLGDTGLRSETLIEEIASVPQNDAEPNNETDAFLSRPPEELAADLLGMTLIYKEKRVRINNVRPQDRNFNEKYLKSRPLFGQDRRDVYVAHVMGGNVMLFLRAGALATADACVAITGAETRLEKFPNANRVVGALGLPKEHVGDAQLAGSQLKLVNLTDRKRK